jgi:hypothetical protein
VSDGNDIRKQAIEHYIKGESPNQYTQSSIGIKTGFSNG